MPLIDMEARGGMQKEKPLFEAIPNWCAEQHWNESKLLGATVSICAEIQAFPASIAATSAAAITAPTAVAGRTGIVRRRAFAAAPREQAAAARIRTIIAKGTAVAGMVPSVRSVLCGPGHEIAEQRRPADRDQKERQSTHHRAPRTSNCGRSAPRTLSFMPVGRPRPPRRSLIIAGKCGTFARGY